MSKPLVHATRGGLIETIYRGDVAVVDAEGKLLYKVGNPREKIAYIRSSAKPIQAIPVVESGAVDHYGITENEMAIFCASHNGEQEHVEVVTSILKKIGLGPEKLQCGVHAPMYPEAAKRLLLDGEKPSEVHCNCSGKHSGMLTLTQYGGHPLGNYTELDHPVQQAMLQAMADMTGLTKDDIIIGTDGCGVPVHGLSVYRMARGWAKLASHDDLPEQRQKACERIIQAMLNNPSKVAGTGRFCTELMTHTHRKLIGKSGANGIYCIGVLDKGIGIAVKIESGDGKVSPVVATEVLRQLGILTEEELESLKNFHNPIIKNHRKDIVGEIKPIFTLEKVE